jgi:hypothetical protein
MNTFQSDGSQIPEIEKLERGWKRYTSQRIRERICKYKFSKINTLRKRR